jgi:aromatic-L-amino-acid/L-tryptophan decarboxylase
VSAADPLRLGLSDEDLQRFASGINSLVADYLATIGERPVFPPVTADSVAERLGRELPRAPEPVDRLLADCEAVLDTNRHNGHPRFFGYVASPASPVGVYADLLASALNANVTSWRSAPSATLIERTVVHWLGDLVGFPTADGLLSSGGSIANLTAVHVAARRALGPDAGRRGLAAGGAGLAMYVSAEAHHSLVKAADVLGLGTDQVRQVPVDERCRMDVAALRTVMAADAAAGLRPFLVAATAGTTGTGAVDPIAAVADAAEEQGCWLHVDGAYGGPAAAVDELRPLFTGLDRADSMTLDPHKWLYTPLDCGALLLRDPTAAPRALAESSEAAYIRTTGYQDDEAFAFWDHGIELSRRFRALKLWLLMRAHGSTAIAASIAEDCRLARAMAAAVDADPDLELMAPVTLSVCCFRVAPQQWRGDDATLDALNAQIMTAVQREGTAYLSGASVAGRTVLRACIVNFRTTEPDIEVTLEAVRRAAREVTRAAGSPPRRTP